MKKSLPLISAAFFSMLVGCDDSKPDVNEKEQFEPNSEIQSSKETVADIEFAQAESLDCPIKLTTDNLPEHRLECWDKGSRIKVHIDVQISEKECLAILEAYINETKTNRTVAVVMPSKLPRFKDYPPIYCMKNSQSGVETINKHLYYYN